jgi:hypothetical protein
MGHPGVPVHVQVFPVVIDGYNLAGIVNYRLDFT